ncbi:MAG: O-antigen ligase family protein [bacterium]
MKRVIIWLLLSIAFLPITYSYSALIPYMSGKTIFLRGVLFIVMLLVTYSYLFDKKFKTDFTQKISILYKKPLVKVIAVSYIFLTLSTLFAFDKYIAFFGTLQRGEGFISFTFFYSFFALTALFFEKRDWIKFFGLTAVMGWILFVYEMMQFFVGIVRPGSFADNPIFLAAYFLFVIFSSFVLWREGVKSKKVYLSILGISTIVISVAGILVTESRGVLIGIIAGITTVLFYFIIVGKKHVAFEKFNLRKTAVGLLIVSMLLGGIFVSTRNAEIWKGIPGLNRLSQVSINDSTTRSRLINTQITLRAISPKQSSIKDTLIGWGWDNYIFAWEKFYDPSIYASDSGIFDRAHDFLLDRLVMTGMLGFGSYVLIWIVFVGMIFKIGKKDVYLASVFLFFGVAYFIQNISAFDTIITYVAFFVVLAYAINESPENIKIETNVRKK